MPCGVCGGLGHEVQNCPHKRTPFRLAGGVNSKRCVCCGRFEPDVERQDTRGHKNHSDLLDLCSDCFLYCCHDGDLHNPGRKPRNCQKSGRPSHWCVDANAES
jgi:hypothetical protein